MALNFAKSNVLLIRNMMTRAIFGPDLCAVCQKITLESLLTPEGFKHVSDPSLLRLESSTNPCRMCSLIYYSVTDVFSYHVSQRWTDSSSRDRFIILRGMKKAGSHLDHILVCCGFATSNFEHCDDRSIPPGTFLIGRLDVFTEAGDPAARFIPRRRLPRDPSSEDSMFMANQLLSECIHTHVECKKPQMTVLPTRILYIGSDDDNKVFLLVSGDRIAKYAALSYCWGDAQNFTATEETWEVLTKGIVLSALPNTIQDAVIVTRKLGLQYLWVDALCIKQDSRIDWELESSKMVAIYGNATVTIAAAGASNCDIGCFIQDSSAENHMLERFSLRLPDLSNGTVFFCVQNYYEPQWDPLNKRAWALQERLLSPRVLVFTAGNMSWQCQTKRRPYGIGSTRLPDFLIKATPVDPPRTWEWNQPTQENEQMTLENIWVTIALDYSSRALTYGQDRLPALSGLASIFQEQTGDVYLAGLWKKTLAQGLMWQLQTPMKFRPLTYHVPTWSWLSVNIQIFYRQVTGPFFVENLEAEVILAGPDRTGAISSGEIKLCGQLKKAQHKEDNSLWDTNIEKPMRVGSCVLDLEYEAINAMDGPLWCLRVVENEGLLLKLCGKKYQRIGIFILKPIVSHGVTGKTWFKDCEPRTITLV